MDEQGHPIRCALCRRPVFWLTTHKIQQMIEQLGTKGPWAHGGCIDQKPEGGPFIVAVGPQQSKPPVRSAVPGILKDWWRDNQKMDWSGGWWIE